MLDQNRRLDVLPSENRADVARHRPHAPQAAGRLAYLAAGWSFLYALAGLYWSLGGGAFPFGSGDPRGDKVSLLQNVESGSGGMVIAIAGAIATVLALLMSRPSHRRAGRSQLLMLGWSLSIALAVLIPDYRPLMALARAPIVLIGMPFGWPDIEFLGPGMFEWPVVNQLWLIVGGALWAGATLRFARGTRDACTSCGRREGARDATSRAAAERWGKWAVYVAIAIPLVFAVFHWAWALDIPLGTTTEVLETEAADNPEIWLAGALLGTIAAGAAFLSLALVRPWGERYPRWIPRIGGKVIAPRTVTIPTFIAAVLVATAGFNAIRAQVLGYYPPGSGLGEEGWGMTAPSLLWPLWGAALAAGAYAYYLRRRGRCSVCGRD